MMETWLATKADKARKTQEAYAYDARQVTAEFGDRLATSVRPSEIRVWVARPGGISVRLRSLTALQAAYGLAVEDELLSADPTARIKLPKAQELERRYLSWFELKALAEETGDDQAPLVWLLGTTGLRLGEAAGLQVGDIREGKIRVARQRHGTTVEPPKGGRGRDVPIPAFVQARMDLQGRGRTEWLFRGARSDRLDTHSWRARVFEPAAARTVGRMVPHELRHTAASLAIASGADVKQVQNMLGHRSATITLDLYGHLWNDDTVATSMDDAYRSRFM
jgi:integrase